MRSRVWFGLGAQNGVSHTECLKARASSMEITGGHYVSENLVQWSKSQEHIAWIRFNRPSALNAISVDLANAFHSAVEAVYAAPDVRVIVLAGEGRAFMAGGDLRAFGASLSTAPQTALGMIEPLHAALVHLAQADAPVVASVQGAVAARA